MEEASENHAQWHSVLGTHRSFVLQLITSAETNAHLFVSLTVHLCFIPRGALSGEQALSAETFFLVKMLQVQGLTSSESEYRGMTVSDKGLISRIYELLQFNKKKTNNSP